MNGADLEQTPLDRVKAVARVAALSAGSGVLTGFAGRPVSVWSLTREQMGAEASMARVYDNIAKYGVAGWFHNWEPAVLRSVWKRMVKGAGYAVADDLELNAWQKALLSSGVITVLTTPVDRLACAYGRNREEATFFEILRSIYAGGSRSFYRGGTLDFGRNGVEAFLVYELNEGRKRARGHYGMNENETNVWEWLAMTFGGATLRGAATNWMEVARLEMQSNLERGYKQLTIRDVYRIKGTRHFFCGGFFARYVVGLMGMAGNYGALWMNDWLRVRGK